MQKIKSPNKHKKVFILIGIVGILLIVGLIIFVVQNKKQNNLSQGWKKDCKSSEKVMMTNSPMNIPDIGNITPLGLVASGHVTPIDHLYFYPINLQSQRDAYPVFAMADGYIVEIQARKVNVESGAAKKAEYRIIMQHSCQTISYFDLVTSLDPAILAQVPQLAKSDYANDIRIPIKAGQEIARIGGQSLDTAVYNMDLTLPGFISPKLYQTEFWKIHTDDFFSYFSDPLLSELLAKNLRQAEPRSGKIDTDLPGKLQGNWFKEGSNGYAGAMPNNEIGKDGKGYWDGHLHIGHDNVIPTEIWVSVGSFNNQGPKHFYVKGNAPEPAEISIASGITKYELIAPANFNTIEDARNYQRRERPVQGVILLQVLADEKLKVEVFPGKTTTQVTNFTANATVYER